ncbi:MAG TPA: hypothetical protein VM782_21300 [Stellaceae bacterium]|nr:hypothetical protein [Stellaceae bacterium]
MTDLGNARALADFRATAPAGRNESPGDKLLIENLRMMRSYSGIHPDRQEQNSNKWQSAAILVM